MSDHKPHRHTRGYLPHYDSPELIQFVTFRLADSLPSDILKTLEYKLKARHISELEYHRQVENALDLGAGATHLKDARIAGLVSDTILKFAGVKYRLIAWVIMPNHVHLLLQVLDGHTLSSVMHSIKSFTASQANKLLGLEGRFWSPDFFDRFIRDRIHFRHVREYIEENPVKANLCGTSGEWPWSSASLHQTCQP